MKRLIFGSGKTASIIKNDGDIVIPHQQCDITNAPLVRTITKEVNPDIVVNCAAKTNLEYCEDNKRITFDTNTVGPINVLMGAAETGPSLYTLVVVVFLMGMIGCAMKIPLPTHPYGTHILKNGLMNISPLVVMKITLF